MDAFTDPMKRLKGGPFLQLLVDHFTSLQEGEEVKKLYMYSGHDTTVAPILHTLGIFNGIAPPYSSMIIFELFEQDGLQVEDITCLFIKPCLTGKDLLQEHHRYCLPSLSSWVYRAVSS